ncbi:MAG: SdpI family protein [Rhodothermales bacterium]|nr:SdpI family protein [Rhodothermales bacterium]
MKLRELIKSDWPAWLVVGLPFVVLAVVWDRLPAELPMHWNMYGEVDRYDAKGFGAWMIPLLGLGMYVLMLAIPWMDPKHRIDPGQKGVKAFRLIIPAMMTGMFGIVCLSWLGYPINTSSAVYLLLCVLFLAMGNFMATMKPNYFIGIRTPWTLESPENWRRTHRLGGKLWVFGSLVMIVLWLFLPVGVYFWVFMAGVLTMSLVPVGYSLVLYLRDKRTAEGSRFKV